MRYCICLTNIINYMLTLNIKSHFTLGRMLVHPLLPFNHKIHIILNN